MRNKAPFILEWVAYHLEIGFDRIIVFSNDCSDGTDEILTALDAAGIITHIPHVVDPNRGVAEQVAQKIQSQKLIPDGSWTIWLDVDEFLNIHPGRGHVDDLISELGDARGMCISWRVFGDSDQDVFHGAFLDERFVRCASHGQAWQNVKTFFRYGPDVVGLSPDKPIMPPAFWEGGGVFLSSAGSKLSLSDGEISELAAGWDLAQINRYAVRTKRLFELKRHAARTGETETTPPDQHDTIRFSDLNLNQAYDRSILRWENRTLRRKEKIGRSVDQSLDIQALIARHYDADTVATAIAGQRAAAAPHKAATEPNMAHNTRQHQSPSIAKDWPPTDPNVLVATCMKDEGPFILEWIAWHKSIGIDNFVVYTNHCTDGTDLILDRLQDMGEVRHLPNPALATGSTYYQPAALAAVQELPEFEAADFFISMDVDEFINVRVGSGNLSDLLTASGPFDALSMTELNHGSNGNLSYEPGFLIEQFPQHQTMTPGKWKAGRGVKTVVRLNGKLKKVRNHRPDFKDGADPVWRDGSGRMLETLAKDASQNGIDCRGTYDFVVLEHFALRSLESFLVKRFRGDVVIDGKRVSQRYWRLRNRDAKSESGLNSARPEFRDYYAKLLSDPQLAALHQDACQNHASRIKSLLDLDEYQEQKNWILENSWQSQETNA